MTNNEEQVLKDFLLDIDCLKQLNDWTDDFNLFDVLRITNIEIRHSNILAWIFDPNENHGLGDSFIKSFITKVVSKCDQNKYSAFDLLLQDFYSYQVYRESNHMDIVLASREEKTAVIIENKIWSGESSHQLNDYLEKSKTEYKDCNQILYVFLTPYGREASDPDNWIAFSYGEIIDPFDFSKSTALVRDSILASGGRREDSIILDYFAGSGTTGHAVINLNREDGGRRKFILVEMADYFDTVLLPRLKKVTFSPEWKDGKPKRVATVEEAERGPRIIKVIRLESYEDALNNLSFDESAGQLGLPFEDYLLKYMLQWETCKSETLLNVEKLSKPFDYCLHIYRDGETRVQKVDLPETFNYLIGLDVAKRQLLDDNGRYYLVYRGMTREGRRTVVIWRETEGWAEEDYKRDRDFVDKHKFAEDTNVIYVNGDSLIPGAQALEGVFKAKMFADVRG